MIIKCRTCGKNIEKERQFCSKSCHSRNREANVEKLKKSKKTCLEKYGTEFNSQSKDHREKVKQRWKNKDAISIENSNLKRKMTNVARYGVDNPMKVQEFKENNLSNIAETRRKSGDEILKKTKLTCLQKYGVDNVSKSEYFIQKMKDTKLDKYGRLHFPKSLDCSDISQAFFRALAEINSDVLDINNMKYYSLNGEMSLQSVSGATYYYDFVANNKIVEFNGVKFHPTLDLEDDCMGWHLYKKDLTAGEVRRKEVDKFELAKSCGYDIFVLWDKEISNNLGDSLLRASKFLRNDSFDIGFHERLHKFQYFRSLEFIKTTRRKKIGPNKGKKASSETRLKQSLSRTGKILPRGKDHKNYIRINDETIEKIIFLYLNDRKTMKEISFIVGYNESKVRQILLEKIEEKPSWSRLSKNRKS